MYGERNHDHGPTEAYPSGLGTTCLWSQICY